MLSSPNPVNEKAARVVAGVVLATVIVIFATGAYWPARTAGLRFVVAAGLESLLGYCLGCKVFGLLMRAGVVPADVCAECADISGRWRTVPSEAE